MTKQEKDSSAWKAEKRYLYTRFVNGCMAIRKRPVRALLPLVALLVVTLLCRCLDFWIRDVLLIFPPLGKLLKPSIFFYAIASVIASLILLGTPREWKQTKEDLKQAGITNHSGEPPLLLRRQQESGTSHMTIWEFETCGIPKSEWEDKRSEIETALNVNLVKIEQGESKKRILLYTISGRSQLPACLLWNNSNLSERDFGLVLGESLLGPVTVNLAKIPHILIGGSTGSGKSVLLKLLLMQALQKGAVVYLADFKGGVDFPAVWHEKCRMCFERPKLLNILGGLVDELERRKSLFRERDSSDLTKYNGKSIAPLPRILFACDEVAELLDKTGRSKDEKEQLGQIESLLSVIARQGRAFGIHLILATQRPDAALIPGQIRNNIDFRVCGRADSVLSQIILDNASASEQIPKDAQGRFITNDGTVFQAFWFDESILEKIGGDTDVSRVPRYYDSKTGCPGASNRN